MLLSHPPSWVNNQVSTFTFRTTVTCSAVDCSSLVANNVNFEFMYYFDWDESIEDDEQYLDPIMTTALAGNGFRSDLT